jgi:hypothetical protein
MPTSESLSCETVPFSRPPEKNLPVISPEEAFPYNQEFRYPWDPPHWIRLRQPSPEGAKLFAQRIEVAGISSRARGRTLCSSPTGKSAPWS